MFFAFWLTDTYFDCMYCVIIFLEVVYVSIDFWHHDDYEYRQLILHTCLVYCQICCHIQKTDKSKVFHLGSAASYHEKSLQYMAKTNAYKEIENGINSCMVHLQRVLALIDPLLKKKAIDLKIWKSNMRPNVNTVELAHWYLLPKPHKVILEDFNSV